MPTAAEHYEMGEQLLNQTRKLMNETIIVSARAKAPRSEIDTETELVMLETVKAGAALAQAHFAAAEAHAPAHHAERVESQIAFEIEKLTRLHDQKIKQAAERAKKS